MIIQFISFLALCYSLCVPINTPQIIEVRTYGSYETGGINVKLINYSGNESVRIFYKEILNKNVDFEEGHPFIRYDANHYATSLFDLKPKTVYELKIILSDQNGKLIQQITKETLTTKREFSIPNAVDKIEVSNHKELTKALSKVTPGSQIIIKPGIYSERVIMDSIQGTATAPIVLMAEDPNNKPHFLNGILINHSSFIIIKSLEVELQMMEKVGAIRILGSNHVTVTDSYIHDGGENYSANIIIAFSDQNIGEDKNGYHLIQNNIISDESTSPKGKEYTHKYVKGKTYYGIKLDDFPGGYNTIRGNTIYGVIDGIASGGDEKEQPVMTSDEENLLQTWTHQNIDIYDNIIYSISDDGIETDGHMVNGRIFRNRIGSCQNAISIASVYPGPIFILRNYIYGFHENAAKMNTKGQEVTRNIYWYHNTIKQIEEASNCVLRGNPGLTNNIVFRNNILEATTKPIDTYTFETEVRHTNHSFDYNLLYTKNPDAQFAWGDKIGTRKIYNSFNEFQHGTLRDFGIMQEEHGIFAKPLLDLTPIKGYSIKSGIISLELLKNSPGIDKGIIIKGINTNFKGKRPDIGAFELE